MLNELRKMFEKPQAVEIYDLVDTLHSCKQAPGKSVSAHVLEMKGYMDQLQALGKPYDNDMAINLINRSLNKDFVDFVRNFNMHCVGKTVSDLHALLIDYEKGLKDKAPTPQQVVAYQPKPKQNPSQKKENPKKDQACHYCNVVGHWKRNCPLYLEELRTNKNKKAEHGAAPSMDLDERKLAHIGKTRMQKLQREGLLESINDGSYDKCESCISGKMTKKPFNNNIERATDLLGLIHTDVRYGYVYLHNIKHEVFETFKVFKSEVKLQLGKKIKALRSDRGGEYLSQEFKDYLSKNGIVQHLTSPYTPQQNGVSERRNRTLLDMVRSMFNLTTLPLSFWDYALESAVRILNMVPTKKVDKTPYETWQGTEFVLFKGLGLRGNSHSQEFSGRDYDLEDDHMDTLPSENTSVIPVEPESLGPPSELIPVQRSERTTRAPSRLCLNMEVEDDVVGDLGEPVNYKAAILTLDKYEDIYMEQPEGYVNPKYPNRVCKLQRSIYGLKQASRQWNKRFDEEIKKFGFTQNRDEPCVYRKASGSNVVFLILYVDDILIMGNNIPRLKEVKDYLGKCFSMKDLGEAAYILGIKIYRDRSKRLIGLSQSAYIDKILKKFNMHNSKKGYLPMEVKHELSNEMCASTPEEVAYMKKVPYASAVGSIMYAVRCTRPDVAFAQNLVSRYQQNPGKLHWVAVKHILKYLRNTRDMFLVYGGKPDTELNVIGAVDWKSQEAGQSIALSATQAEYMASFRSCSGGSLIREIFMKGARHFLQRYHYVREQVESGEIKILKVHTYDNLADPFTKVLPRGKVTDLANGIGLQLASSFMHTCD
ncbi:retrotransposon protein, putative, ty1-copia subclass [Tanacetum coccineum]